MRLYAYILQNFRPRTWMANISEEGVRKLLTIFGENLHRVENSVYGHHISS